MKKGFLGKKNIIKNHQGAVILYRRSVRQIDDHRQHLQTFIKRLQCFITCIDDLLNVNIHIRLL